MEAMHKRINDAALARSNRLEYALGIIKNLNQFPRVKDRDDPSKITNKNGYYFAYLQRGRAYNFICPHCFYFMKRPQSIINFSNLIACCECGNCDESFYPSSLVVKEYSVVLDS